MSGLDLRRIRDPNALGELFRSYAFDCNGEDCVGCYTCFELIAGFKTSEDKVLKRKVASWLGLDSSEAFEVFHEESSGLTVAWYWDGDGSLLFAMDEIVVVNFDCKKNYGWSFLEANEVSVISCPLVESLKTERKA